MMIETSGRYPEDFCEDMKRTLSQYRDEAFLRAFFEAMDEPVLRRSIRFNRMKILRDLDLSEKDADVWMARFAQDFFSHYGIKAQHVPWSRDGYFYTSELRLSKVPEYRAGLFYIQEASAMLPGELIQTQAGEFGLDLCAAPGGKTLRMAEGLGEKGYLLSNDISRSRARILLYNVKHLGLNNTAVISVDPKTLLPQYAGLFDCIVLDAPCSGEGMMRRHAESIEARRQYDASAFTPIQRSLLELAVALLKEGGRLVYSTCTFNTSENEAQILDLLRTHQNLELLDGRKILASAEGISQGFPIDGDERLKNCLRIFPNECAGEGHFAALLRKGTLSEPQSDRIDEPAQVQRDPHMQWGTQSRQDPQARLEDRSFDRDRLDHDRLNRDRLNCDRTDGERADRARLLNGKKKAKAKAQARSGGTALHLDFAKKAFSRFLDENAQASCLDFISKMNAQAMDSELRLQARHLILSIVKSDVALDQKGMHVLREGIVLGEIKEGKVTRFIPDEQLLAALPPRLFKAELRLEEGDPILNRYIQGQTLSMDDISDQLIGDPEVEYISVSLKGHGLGWLKREDRRLKNLLAKNPSISM